MSRIGVVGGTFDPIHLGHLAMAEAARDCAHLDLVLIIPSGLPPHRGDTIASPPERLHMCRLAVQGLSGFEVSDLEVERGGPSYTVDTLRDLKRNYPNDELFLVLGWDAAKEIGSWREPEAVLALAQMVIVSRPGWPDPTEHDLKAVGIDPKRAIRCWVVTPDIEATDIRRRLRQGEPLTGLLDPEVELYLREGRLYQVQRA